MTANALKATGNRRGETGDIVCICIMNVVNEYTGCSKLNYRAEMCPILQTILANLTAEVVTCEFGKTTEILRRARIIY